jgi:capsular exopolysaccharide synthesis family protein
VTARGHFQTIWRRKWWILVASVLVAAVVYFVSDSQARTYRAQAQLNVIPGQPPSITQPVGGDVTTFLASTYAQLGQTRPVIQDATARARLRIDEQTAADRLNVSASSQVGFISISATGPSPADATALAAGEAQALSNAVTVQQNALVQTSLAPVQAQITAVGNELAAAPSGSPQQSALADQYQALVQSAANRQLATKDQLTIVSPARADSGPISPTPKRDALLGFVTALVVFSELAVGIELLSDRFSREDLDEDIRRVTGLPVLARVPGTDRVDAVEAFRTLRTNLLFMDTGQKLRTVAVVSTEPGAGKSFTSINLAGCMAELGTPAALVDADLRRPTIDERLGLPRRPGLSEVLHGHDPTTAVHRVGAGSNLMVLTAGAPVSDPAGLLGSLGRRVFSGLSDAQLIVVDTPAEAPFPDAAAIALQCDATILVLDPKLTRRRAARAMLGRLRQVNTKPIGVVVNRAPVPPRRYGYYSYSRRENGRDGAGVLETPVEDVR